MTQPRSPDPSALSDSELVARARRGERAAVETLARRLVCVPRILTAINERGNPGLSAHDLEDLAQDTLMLVLRKLDDFGGYGELRAWVYRFCYLEYMNRVRRESRHSAVVQTSLGDVAEDPGWVPGAHPVELEDLELSLERLGPPEADVIRLKHYDQLTFDEIGRRLGISANTAKTQYYRGIARLQRELRALGMEEPA